MLQNPAFATSTAYRHMPGGLGSSGAFQISTSAGEFVVKEGGAKLDVEVFSNLLGAALATLFQSEAGSWRVLPIRVIMARTPLSKDLVRSMSVLSKDDEIMVGQRLAKCEAVMLMEFVKATALEEAKPSPESLFALGSGIVFDMLINNWDRIPVLPLWNNTGNPGNVLFPEGGGVTLIDQCVTVIGHADNKAKYLDSAKRLCRDALGFSKDTSEDRVTRFPVFMTALQSVRAWLLARGGYDIGEEGEAQFGQGFIHALNVLMATKPSEEKADATTATTEEKATETTDGTTTEATETTDATTGEKVATTEKVEKTNSGSAFEALLSKVMKETGQALADEGKVITQEAAVPVAVETPQWRCELCQVTLPSQDRFDKHVSGSLHRIKQQEVDSNLASQQLPTTQPSLQWSASTINSVSKQVTDACGFVLDVYNTVTS